jgi:phosphate transport system permease protein
MSAPIDTPTVTDEPRSIKKRKPKPRREHSARTTALSILGATIAGVGAAALVGGAFGGAVLPEVIIGYLVFVAVIAISELMRIPDHDDVVVDLTAHEAASDEAVAEREPSPRPALAVVRDDEEAAVDQPRATKRIGGVDVAEFAVAAIGAGAVAELVRIFLHMQSTLGAFVWWYVAFIALLFLLTRDRMGAETGLDRVMTVLLWSAGLLVASALGWMLVFVVTKGWKLLTGGFFTHDLSRVGPLTPGGGAEHAIIGTLEQVGIATIIIVPIGILTAVYLNEVRGRLAGPIRFIVDAMSGLPSIVAGLLIFGVWVINHGFSGIAGAAAIAILMLPTMTRASEEILRTVPNSLREGALALGAPNWRLVQRVVLPTAIAGLLTAMLLAIARAVGETAPVLLTAFGADNTNRNPLNGPQEDLPMFVWKLIRVPFATQNNRAWTGALVLCGLVFVLFSVARIVGARGQRKLGRAR